MLYQDIESKAELFRCIGDPTCLKLLFLLTTNEKLCVSDLTSELNVSMPAVSHQLRKLRNLGLLERERDGQMICYSLAKNNVADMVKTVLKKSL